MIPLSLAGKVALVTEASRKIGIGSAICRLFAQAGADVFFTYYTPYDHTMFWGIHPEEPSLLLEELHSLGVRVAAVEADLADPAVPARLFEQMQAEFGRPWADILVNNATHDVEVDLLHLTPEILDQHYAVNVRGPVLLCAEFARRFQQSVAPTSANFPSGRIINLVSGELVSPMVGNLPYVVSKGAIDALTITLSGELARLGITVNAIDPGITDTGWISPDLHARWVESSFFGRVGLPQDAAHTILFLASPLGAWITGQIIHSRGGL